MSRISLADITEITLDKPGFDDMCVAEIALRINRNWGGPGLVVYHQQFGDTPSTCRWVSGTSALTLTIVDLHSSAEWQAATPTTPAFGMASEWLRAHLQAAFADALHGTAARLGSESIWTETLSPTTLRVHVSLRVDASVLGTADTRAHFDLILQSTCTNNVLDTVLTTANVNAASYFDNVPILDLLESVVFAPVLAHISETIEGMIHATSRSSSPENGCGLVLGFDTAGDIALR